LERFWIPPGLRAANWDGTSRQGSVQRLQAVKGNFKGFLIVVCVLARSSCSSALGQSEDLPGHRALVWDDCQAYAQRLGAVKRAFQRFGTVWDSARASHSATPSSSALETIRDLTSCVDLGLSASLRSRQAFVPCLGVVKTSPVTLLNGLRSRQAFAQRLGTARDPTMPLYGAMGQSR
jgi:hypothetical protein